MRRNKGNYYGDKKCYLCRNLSHTHEKPSKDNITGEVFYCEKSVTDEKFSSPPVEIIECNEFDYDAF